MGREPGRFDHVPRDVACVVLIIKLLPTEEPGYEANLSSIQDCHKWFPSIYCVPYSGKLLREKTFVNFTVLWLYTKVFSARFGAWHPLALQKRAIRESFLRENHIFTHSRKFSPSKVSRYTVSAFARL